MPETRSGNFHKLRDTTLLLAIQLTLYFICYALSPAYRFCFKATVIVYAPIIWIAQATLRSPLPTKLRLERITKGEIEKVRRWLSGIILAALIAKFFLAIGWVDLDYILKQFHSQKIVDNLVVPGAWPWWQLTLTTDALLTIILRLFADAAQPRLDSQQVWREKTVLAIVSSVCFIRAVAGFATISHFFFLALIEVAPNSVLRLLGA